MKRVSLSLLSAACLISLALMVMPSYATTYVFGEDGYYQDLTGSGSGSTWTSSNTYIIAGDCYVPSGQVLTIQQGVQVFFDYDYGGDYGSPMYPTIRIDGRMDCNGSGIAPVFFTNLTGTASGEFKGILVGDGAYNGGILNASYTVFQYGGASTALIRLNDNAELSLMGSYVRYSATRGVNSVGDNAELTLTQCYIDSNGATGIDLPNALDALSINGLAVIHNGGDGIIMEDDLAHLELVVRGGYVSDNAGDGWRAVMGYGGVGGPELEIWNCQFYQNGSNGCVIDLTEGSGNFYLNNCCFAGNGESGLYIDNLDPYVEDVEETRLLNSVFWDNDGSGLAINDEQNDMQSSDENPIHLQNSVFGQNAYNVESISGYNLLFRDDINAFDEDDNFYAFFPAGSQIIGGFELAEEEADVGHVQEPPYDFHIRWNSPNVGEPCLINTGESDLDCGLDPDGSLTDLGLFGGQLGDDFPDFDFYSAARDFEFYIRVGDLGVPYSEENHNDQGIVLYSTVYRSWGDWTTLNFLSFTIEAGTTIEFHSDGQFKFGGIFHCDGTEEQPIAFRGMDDVAWDGISTSGMAASPEGTMTWVSIEDVTSSNYPGLSLWSIVGNPPDHPHFIVQNLTVTGTTGYGISLSASAVRLIDCVARQNTYGGCKVFLTSTRNVIISGCDFSDNGDALNFSAGLICQGSYSNPSVGYRFTTDDIPVYDDFTRICDNEKYGLYCSSSADPVLRAEAGPTLGGSYRTNVITGNANSQIRLDGAGCIPLLYGGHNDIYSGNPNVLALDNRTGSTIDARDNYWGTDNPGPVANQLFYGSVTYSPWDIGRNTWEVNSVDLMALAMGWYLSDNTEDVIKCINLFKEVASNSSYGSNRIPALSYLRDAYAATNSDLSELQEWYANYAARIDDLLLSKQATRWSIWCYADAGDFEHALEAFEDQRLNADNLIDSLWAALDIASVRFLAGLEIDIPGGAEDSLRSLDYAMTDLSEKLAQAETAETERLDTPSHPASFDLFPPYPNPFNSAAQIPIRVNRTARFEMSVFGVDGRRIAQLNFGTLFPGNRILNWRPEALPSGCYLIRLDSGFDSQTTQVQLVR